MKKIFIVFCWLVLCNNVTGQTINLHIDTLSRNRARLTVMLNGEPGNLESVRVELCQVFGSDTVIVTESAFSFTENFPPSFYSLKRTESGYEFGLGLYDMENYLCRLYLKRENETEQVTTL